MYSHILVPLDGSPLAEQVLPQVYALPTEKENVCITLLMSVSPYEHPHLEHGDSIFVSQEAPNTERLSAQRYLHEMAHSLQARGYQVDIEISNLKVEDAIVKYADQHKVDLIAMSTHGRSGIGRWFFGSVTQKVLQMAPAPVLVVCPLTGEVDLKPPARSQAAITHS